MIFEILTSVKNVRLVCSAEIRHRVASFRRSLLPLSSAKCADSLLLRNYGNFLPT